MQNCELNFNSINSGFYNSQLVYKKATVSPDRKVDSYEFEYFPQSGGVSVINGEAHPILQGNVLFAAPGCIRHSILHFRAYYVHCNTDSELLKGILDRLPNISRFGENAIKLESIFKQIIQHSRYSEPVHMLYAEAKLLELIFRLANQNGEQENNKAYSPIILQGIEYITRNYKSDIKLNDIAKAVGLTPVYFHNIFLKSTGQTPHECLLEKRLSMAKEMLSNSDMSLVDVSAECGFSSQSYFNVVFKRYCGTTPLKYRQNAFNEYQL